MILDEETVAELRKVDDGVFIVSGRSRQWLLSKKTNQDMRPFSMVIFASDANDQSKRSKVLEISDHFFFFQGHFYVFGGIPAGRVPKDHLLGAKFICRLDNFPFSHLDEIDDLTKSRLKRHRGKEVGEFSGLGSQGFHVRLAHEFDDADLPLAAAAYLMYSSM
jgi:hypothetical protein